MGVPRWSKPVNANELEWCKEQYPDFKVLDTGGYLWYYWPSFEKTTGWFSYFYFYSKSKQDGSVKILRQFNFWSKLFKQTLSDIYPDCVTEKPNPTKT
jgi:hypothetical protein